MKIGIVGTGYVGLVTGVCLAKMGHTVTCVDNDERKVKTISAGRSPIYEPGLEEMLRDVLEAGSFTVIDDIATMTTTSEVIFICVGTPSKGDGSADLSMVFECAKAMGECVEEWDGHKVFVVKSTVPPMTTSKVGEIIAEASKCTTFGLAMCPEFLKEGTACTDFIKPDRIVIGVDGEQTRQIMKRVFEQFVRNDNPMIFTDIVSAELTKYASNCMLASRISLMNEFARVCDSVGGNILDVRRGVSYDRRIGREFLYAGPGYGGSCFPKDVSAICDFAKDRHLNLVLLPSINRANEVHKDSFASKVVSELSDGDGLAIWGLSFKANTDDMRESASISLVCWVRDEFGTKVGIGAYDPKAIMNAEKLPELNGVSFGHQYDVVKDAKVLAVVTEWDVFRYVDFEYLKEIMAPNPVIVDGRNLYDRTEVERYGFRYIGVGR